MARTIKNRAFMFESLTFDTAKTLTYRTNLYHKTLRDSSGMPVTIRVNGAVKLWKTRPNDIKVPCKYGLKEGYDLTQDNMHDWSLSYTEVKENAVHDPILDTFGPMDFSEW